MALGAKVGHLGEWEHQAEYPSCPFVSRLPKTWQDAPSSWKDFRYRGPHSGSGKRFEPCGQRRAVEGPHYSRNACSLRTCANYSQRELFLPSRHLQSVGADSCAGKINPSAAERGGSKECSGSGLMKDELRVGGSSRGLGLASLQSLQMTEDLQGRWGSVGTDEGPPHLGALAALLLLVPRG